MPKGFTTMHLLKGKEPLLRQMVCEVRFRDGQLYLDHCGRLLKKLAQSSPEWVIGTEPNPRGTTVFHVVECAVLNFSLNGASLDLNKTNMDDFIDQDEAQQFTRLADQTLGLVFDELEVKAWTRIGYRELHYFPCESKGEMEEWLKELGVFSVSCSLPEAFACKLGAVGISVVMEGEERSYRIGVNGVERSAQLPVGDATLTIRSSGLPANQQAALAKTLKKQRQRQINTAFAAVLDIDAYQQDPVDLDVGSFIQESASHNLERFRGALAAASGSRGK